MGLEMLAQSGLRPDEVSEDSRERYCKHLERKKRKEKGEKKCRKVAK